MSKSMERRLRITGQDRRKHNKCKDMPPTGDRRKRPQLSKQEKEMHDHGNKRGDNYYDR